MLQTNFLEATIWEMNEKCISPDMSRGIDRNQLKVMGRIQSSDAVMKNKSTTMYGNIVALDESFLKEDLLYVGTDDGLIHVSDNGGTWNKYDNFKGIPQNTYVNSLLASKHNADRGAVFNNHKKGDFNPYVMVFPTIEENLEIYCFKSSKESVLL